MYTPNKQIQPIDIPYEIERPSLLVIPFLVNVIFNGIAGGTALVLGIVRDANLWITGGGLLILLGILWTLLYNWNRKVPYMRLTQDEVMFFLAMARCPNFIRRERIQQIRIEKKKLYIRVAGERPVAIRFPSAIRGQIDNVVQFLNDEIKTRNEQKVS